MLDKIKADTDLHRAVVSLLRRTIAFNSFIVDKGNVGALMTADRDLFAQVASNKYAVLLMSYAPYAIVGYVDTIAKIPSNAENRNEMVAIAMFGIIDAAAQVVLRVLPDHNVADIRAAVSAIFEETANG